MKFGSKYLQPGSLVFAALVLFVMTVAACDLSDDEVTVHVSSYENLCGEIAEVMCANMFQCCSESDIQQSMGVITDVSERECQRDKRLYCEERLSPILFALENGSTSINTNALNSCLTAIVAPGNTCVEMELERAWIDLCIGVDFFEGNQSVNDTCYWDFECAPDAYCMSGMSCKALPTLNEDCSNLPCVPGLYCGLGSDNNLICQQYQELDEECSVSQYQGLLCDPETMYCEYWDTSDTGWCLEKKGLGVACTSDEECESSECAPGYCEGSEDYCYDDDDCWYYGGSCLGEIVCVGNPEITNYCSLGLGIFSLFPNPNYYY